MAIKNGPVFTGPMLYTYIAAIIPTMPQAIKQITHKLTEIHKITICIGDITDYKKTSKQNS